MKGRIFSLLLVCPTITGLAAFGIAQNGSGPSSTAQLKQIAYIKASNTKMDDHFANGGTLEGHGVAISGDGSTLAVGAPYESSGARGIDGNQNDNSVYNAGAVYIFVQQNNNWSQQAYIKASNPGQSYKFGFHVSLSQTAILWPSPLPAKPVRRKASTAIRTTNPFHSRALCMSSREPAPPGPSRRTSKLQTRVSPALEINSRKATGSVSQSP